jgi:hypothetical protein
LTAVKGFFLKKKKPKLQAQMLSFDIGDKTTETIHTLRGTASRCTNKVSEAATELGTAVIVSTENLTTGFNSSINKICDVLKEATTSTTVTVNHHLPLLESIYNQILEYFQIPENSFTKLLAIIVVNVGARYFFKKRWVALGLQAATLYLLKEKLNLRDAAMILTVSNLITEIVSYCKQQFFATSEFTPQMATDKLITMFTTLASVGYFMATGNRADKTVTENLIHSISGFKRFNDGVKSLFDFICEFFVCTINAIGTAIGSQFLAKVGGTPAKETIEQIQVSYNKILLEARELKKFSASSRTDLMRLISETRATMASLPTSQTFGVLRGAYYNLLTSMENTLKLFNVKGAGRKSTKRVPVCYVIIGGPGIGKSYLMERINDVVAYAIFTPQQWENYCANPDNENFCHNPQDQYWEGYHGQAIFTIDDFGQMAPSPDPMLSESLLIIRLVNAMPTPLVMANLELKADGEFSSVIIAMSSNDTDFKTPGIKFPDAFFRRPFSIFSCVQGKFALVHTLEEDYKEGSDDKRAYKRMPDWDKINAYKVANNIPLNVDFDHCNHYLYEWKIGKIISGPHSIDYIAGILVAYAEKLRKDEMIKLSLGHNRRRALSGLPPEPMSPDSDLSDDVLNQLGFEKESYFNYILSIGGNLNIKTLHTYATDYLNLVVDKAIISARDVTDWAHSHPMLAKTLMALTTITATYGLYKTMYSTPEDELETQSGASRVMSRALGKTIVTGLSKQYNCLSEGMINHMTSVYKKQFYSIVVHNLKDGVVTRTVMGFCIFIVGRLAIMNEHYVRTYEEWRDLNGLEVKFSLESMTDSSKCFNINFSDVEYANFPGKHDVGIPDVVFIIFPKYVQQHTSIIEHFCPDDEPAFEKPCDLHLILPKPGNDTVYNPLPVVGVTSVDSWGQYKDQRTMRYMFSARGMCGTLLLLTDRPSSTIKIVGIHSAGNVDGIGVANIISTSSVRNAVTWYESKTEPILPEFLKDTPTTLGPESRLPNIVPTKLVEGYQTAVGSALKKTRLHGKFSEVLKFPVKVSPYKKDGLLMDPYTEARMLFRRNYQPVDMKLLYQCAVSYSNRIFTSINTETLDTSYLTFEEAVRGIPGLFKGIPRGTSAGYPYSSRSKKKYSIFGNGSEYEFTSDLCIEIRQVVEECIEQLEQGYFVDTYYSEFIKDEIRKKGKGGRLVCCASIIETIISRMLLGRFYIFMTQTVILNGTAIGLNPYGEQWDSMIKEIDRFKYKMDGDHKNWDFSVIPAVQEVRPKVVETYYRKLTIAQSTHLKQMSYTKHVALTFDGIGILYEWYGMMVSGSPGTATFNSIDHNITHRYCICKTLLDRAGLPKYEAGSIDFELLEKSFSLITLGDDMIAGHSEELNISITDMSEQYAKIGMTFTAADKSVAVDVVKTDPTEIEFLKRRSRYHPGLRMWISLLEISSILHSMYYMEKGVPTNTLQETVDTCLKELSRYGETTFKQYVYEGVGKYEPMYPIFVKNRLNTFYCDFDEAFAASCKLEAFQKL